MNQYIKEWYEKNSGMVTSLSDDIWKHPEIGMKEYETCRKTAEFLRGFGFAVEESDAAGKGGRANCLTAKWGSRGPVIGIIGEFDALPGMGQEAVPYYKPIPGPGHGCRHNLMAAGCAAAAAALKEALEREHREGTVVYFGCPAEETFEGKVYMLHSGLFDGVDVCLAWHPMGMEPGPLEIRTNAVSNFELHFHGVTAHAGADPEKGRSALDACELTNVGVQYLREHVTSDVRMHSVYLAAGEAANIIPDYAALNYFVRAQSAEVCRETARRVQEVAYGAARMTETELEIIQKAFAYDTLPNNTLNQAMYESAVKIPEIEYTVQEMRFAKEVWKNANGGRNADVDILPKTVAKPAGKWGHGGGSTDVGDLSWNIPTVQFWGHGRMVGCPNHHWSTTACMANGIGHKAELYSGKVLAQTAYDLVLRPELIGQAWEEFRKQRTVFGDWHCWLEDRKK